MRLAHSRKSLKTTRQKVLRMRLEKPKRFRRRNATNKTTLDTFPCFGNFECKYSHSCAATTAQPNETSDTKMDNGRRNGQYFFGLPFFRFVSISNLEFSGRRTKGKWRMIEFRTATECETYPRTRTVVSPTSIEWINVVRLNTVRYQITWNKMSIWCKQQSTIELKKKTPTMVYFVALHYWARQMDFAGVDVT